MAQNIKYYALNSLPQTDAEAGSVYYLSNGEQYIGKLDGSYLKISDTVFVDELPEIGTSNKIYVLTENSTVKTLIYQGSEYIEISSNGKKSKNNTFIFFTNKLLNGDTQVRTRIPYNAKLTKIETILSNVSLDTLSFTLEKSVDGLTFTPTNINVSVQPNSLFQSLDIVDEHTFNEGDILRLVLATNNEDVNGLTVNISIEEI